MLPKADTRKTDTSRRMGEIKELLGLFVYERMIYLGVTVVSVIVLLICAVKLMLTGESDLVTLLGLFGPSGGIIYSTGRLLRMWNEALRVLYPVARLDEDKGQN